MTLLQTVLQFARENPYYICWLVGTFALCGALVSLHSGEEDYLDDHEDDAW